MEKTQLGSLLHTDFLEFYVAIVVVAPFFLFLFLERLPWCSANHQRHSGNKRLDCH
jgi:hypothetical protein